VGKAWDLAAKISYAYLLVLFSLHSQDLHEDGHRCLKAFSASHLSIGQDKT